MGDEGVFDTGGADAEAAVRAVGDVAPEQLAGPALGDVVEDVVEQHAGVAVEQGAVPGGVVLRPEGQHVHQGDGLVRLPRQVPPQVALGHGGDRVTAHGRVAVYAVGLVADRGEEVAERLVAAQHRRAHDHRCLARAEDTGADVDGAADAADLRCAVEGRADLVVHQRGAERAQAGEYAGQVLVHPGGGLGPADAGDADGAGLREPRQLRGRRPSQEQDRGHAVDAERLHDVGGAGEVVAVVGEQWCLGHRANVSRARARAGCSLA